MKLLVNATCITSGTMTGIERFACHIARELLQVDRNIEVIASSPSPEAPFSSSPASLRFTGQCLGSREYLARALWDQIFFRCYLTKSKPDVVFFPMQDGLFFPGVKQIVTVHDLHYLHFGQAMAECRSEISWFRKGLYRIKMPHVLKRSSAIIAVSESTKQDIVAFFGIPPEKIYVIYNGYDEQRFRVMKNPQPLLDRYGLQAGKYFLFVGSILRHKNLVRLVQAFAHLDSDVKLVVAGACKDAEYLQEVQKAAAEFEVSDNSMRYLEYVPDEELPYLYSGASAFLLPSLHEGFGVPIIEAMACGVPVITSKCSAMPEVAGDAALLVDPYSVEDIAAAMQKVLCDSNYAEDLRRAGLRRVAWFRWSNSAKKLYDLCKMVSES